MIDRSKIGTELTPVVAHVEAGRIRSFARAIGETNPIYFDESAARAAAYPSLPVPPTYLFCLMMLDSPAPFEILDVLRVDIARLLHGEQSFSYHSPACAGDRVVFRERISDIYDRKGGLLEFIVGDTIVTNQREEQVADLRRVLVVRNMEGPG